MAPAAPPARKRGVAVAFEEQERRTLSDFQRTFGLHFRHPNLLKLALTHRSYLHVTGAGPRESNERLEYLGDSVLGLVTSEHLYRRHPDEHEGQLTKTKSLLVSKAILSRRALAMKLGQYVLMSHSEVESGGRQRLSILADAFEAVIGAIYLDQGFEAARAFIERWLLSEARVIVADKRHTNYKSHLQEYVQSAFRTHPVYRIRSAMGPDHSKQFMVEVLVGRRVLGEGRGQNKKDAEQAAARDALDRVGNRPRESAEESTVPRTRSTEPSREETRRAPAPAPPQAADEDLDEHDGEGRRRRRRGRRGGRGRRDREEAPRTDRPVAEEPSGAEATPMEPPSARRPEREWGGRSVPRPLAPGAAPPAPPVPMGPLETPPVHRFRPQLEEDEHEEVGRPEGPAHEVDLAARSWTPVAPDAPAVEERPAPAWPADEPTDDVEDESDSTPGEAVRGQGPMLDAEESEESAVEPEFDPAPPLEPSEADESEPGPAPAPESPFEEMPDDEPGPAGPGIERAAPPAGPRPPEAPSYGRRPGRVRRPFGR